MDAINSIANMVSHTIRSMPTEITQGEAELFNSLPIDEVADALRNVLMIEQDYTVKSRAFDAILKLETYDRVQFLIDLCTTEWRLSCCRELAKYNDRRAIEKLCEILLEDEDPDVRFTAAESLASIGDVSALNALYQAEANDAGKDYEGFAISNIASKAIKSIQQRLTGIT